jgi:Fungal Zn(2)-Cys(6) binuclear cluster domain
MPKKRHCLLKKGGINLVIIVPQLHVVSLFHLVSAFRDRLDRSLLTLFLGHCRRRKIRCIPAQGDPQNRCSNCIRLKKPCNFFPVDQQPQTDAGHRADAQVQGAVGPASSSSSPTESAGPADMPNSLPFSHLSMPPIQNIGGAQIKRTRTDSFSEKKGATSHFFTSCFPNPPLDPAYSHSHDLGPPSAGWILADSVNMSKGSSDMPSSYWRMNSHESPMTPAFSPFSSNPQLPHHPTWSPAATEPSPREEFGWPVPQRSMSYGNHETLPHHSNYSFHHPPQSTNIRDEFSNRPSPHQLDVYPPLPPTTNSLPTADVTTVATPTATSPQSSGSAPPFPAAQGWQPYPYKVSAIPSTSEGFSGWYGQAPSLPSQPQGAGGEGMPPATTYSHAESYNGIYYHNTNQGR